MSDLLLAPDISDEQRRRLWKQAILRAERFGAEFFVAIVPKVVSLPAVEMTAKAIFDDTGTISSTLRSADNHSRLARGLMGSFRAAGSNTIKGDICKYCENLIVRAALADFRPETLTKEEFDIIEAAFGHSKELKRLGNLEVAG